MSLHLTEIAPDTLGTVVTPEVVLIRAFIHTALALPCETNSVVRNQLSRLELTQSGASLEGLPLYKLWNQLMLNLPQQDKPHTPLVVARTHLWSTELVAPSKPRIMITATHRMIYGVMPEVTVAVTARGTTAQLLIQIQN